MNLKDATSLVGVCHVDKNMTEENFPAQSEEIMVVEGEWRLFSFESRGSFDNIVSEMKNNRCRPATVREKLWWAAKNWDRKSTIIALGQRWFDPQTKKHRPSALGTYFGDTAIRVLSQGEEFFPHCYFLGIYTS